MGFLNDLSVLKPYDLKIINDHAYYEPEIENKKFDTEKLFKQIILYYEICLEILRKFLHLKKLQIDVIHPYSKFKLCWDMIHSFLIIFLLFYIPLSLSFGLSIIGDNQKMGYSVILFIDMFLEMNTLYFNYGLEVKDRSKIIKNYLKSYCFPDFLALMSIAFKLLNFGSIGFQDPFQLLFFLKIITLIKVIFSKNRIYIYLYFF